MTIEQRVNATLPDYFQGLAKISPEASAFNEVPLCSPN